VAARDADRDTAVLGNRDVVWPVAELHLLDELAVLAVEHVERAVVLVAYINPRAVRREPDAMHRLRTLEHLHHLVGRGIDHVDAVASAVGDVDADQLSAGRAWDRKGRQGQG
jgi:hypothetical protein